MESVSLYSEARNEYLKQLATWIVPPLVEFFRKEYDRIAKTEGKRVMYAFQSWCSEVPRWNQDVIDSHVEDLLTSCRCDYVEDLMTAVFIAHTKMLTAIRINSRQKKLQITLPKLDHFLHRIFVECARAFWKAPFLFSEDLPIIDRQKNILQAESMCTEAIGGAVRSLLPIKSILRDNLLEDEEDIPLPKKKKVKEESDSDSDSEDELEDKVEELVKPIVAKEPLKVEQVEETSIIEEPLKVAPKAVEPLKVEPVVPNAVEEPLKVEPVVPKAVEEPLKVEPVVPKAVEEPLIDFDEIPVVKPVVKSGGSELPTSLKPVHVFKEPTPVQLIKEDTPVLPSSEVVIDTEPAVRFSPYDVVFDENKPDVSEMRYVPKMSIEDYDYPPRIQIGSEASLDDDIETIGGRVPEPIEDEEMALSDGDFESI
jgi:hypothetical protein